MKPITEQQAAANEVKGSLVREQAALIHSRLWALPRAERTALLREFVPPPWPTDPTMFRRLYLERLNIIALRMVEKDLQAAKVEIQTEAMRDHRKKVSEQIADSPIDERLMPVVTDGVVRKKKDLSIIFDVRKAADLQRLPVPTDGRIVLAIQKVAGKRKPGRPRKTDI